VKGFLRVFELKRRKSKRENSLLLHLGGQRIPPSLFIILTEDIWNYWKLITGQEATSLAVTAPFNNIRTNAFRLRYRQSNVRRLLPATAERALIKSLSTVRTTKQCSAVVGSWEKPPNIWLTVAKNAFVGWSFKFRVCMLLEGAVIWYGLGTFRNLSSLVRVRYRKAWVLWLS